MELAPVNCGVIIQSLLGGVVEAKQQAILLPVCAARVVIAGVVAVGLKIINAIGLLIFSQLYP